MLVILIPAVWLTLVLFFVIVCRGAARADALLMAAPTRTRPPVRQGALVLFADHRGRTPRDPRLRRSAPLTVRGVRGRAGRCAAGS